MTISQIKKLNIPTSAGSYQFYDKDGKIIYVGKATNLRTRVSSYWRKNANHTPAKFSMLKKITAIKWIETASETEALLLEANLIKKYQPVYNILLRDDKRYVYIKISTEEKWPRVFITRKMDKSGRYFGPFTSTLAVKETLKVLRKIWPFYVYPHTENKNNRYQRLNRSMGIFAYPEDQKEYLKNIKEITLFLEGKRAKIEKEIKLRITNYEVKINKEKNKEEKENLDEKLNTDKYRLINLERVLANANIIGLEEKYQADVVELAKILGLLKIPERIEGYDISNIFGREAVGSMVVFANGEPDKNEYRKFNIKNLELNDDTGMLKEVLERRLNNSWPLPDLIIVDGGKGQLNAILSILKKNKKEIPVIGISKGEGLRSAHAPDKIFFPGVKTPLQLPLASPALHVIKRVRDEAHRFAITFHKQRRSKKLFQK